MFKSMMRKELMETRAVIFFAGFLFALPLVIDAVAYHLDGYIAGDYRKMRWSPLLNSEIFQFLWIIPFGFAILLGFVQTLTDSFQGTWGYLLHLPPGRRWVISSKLLVGASAYLACNGLFLFGCLLNGFSRQTEVHPFQWSMINPYVQLMLIGLLIYLGTFLTGLRPARWYATRLLPLLGCMMLAWMFFALPQSWVYGLVPLALVCGLLVGLILYIGDTRDFA